MPIPAKPATRSAGVLLHVTSLPNAFGIGDLGPAAHRWIDVLADAHQTWWQTLPLNPPDAGGSPYSAASAMAGNPMLISPELLARDGLLTKRHLKAMNVGSRLRVNFARVTKAKSKHLAIAADVMLARSDSLRDEFERFSVEQAGWLDDFALFAALRKRSPEMPWIDWPRSIVRREPAALVAARTAHADAIRRHGVLQFLFDRQMRALRDHARSRRVKILGDMPIYLSHDSVDCWANRSLFQLDARGKPIAVAGVPPDQFSADGQRWGNPLYDWDAMQADGFRWWIARMRAALKHADIVRIDHFRGLAQHWRIPAKSLSAKNGKWIDTPGNALLTAISNALGGMPVVAEDLGVITPDVEALRDRWKLLGMQILQFGFGGDATNTNLPHNYRREVIAYPGNHDNDTCVGWFKSLDRATKRLAMQYVPDVETDPAHEMMRAAFASVATCAIVQAQDVLGLDGQSRMNAPGTVGKRNWTWRMDDSGFRDPRWKRLAQLTTTYGRACF